MISMARTWQEIPGFFNFDDLYFTVVEEAPQVAHFVEVGAMLGRSVVYLATEVKKSGKQIQIDAIDLWDIVGMPDLPQEIWNSVGKDGIYDIFCHNIKACFVDDIIRPIRMSSIEASKLYEDQSLDFVFIDANHEYEHVMKDLLHWYPKVKIGEVFGGHDWDWTGVRRAVEEFFGALNKEIRIERTSWVIIK